MEELEGLEEEKVVMRKDVCIVMVGKGMGFDEEMHCKIMNRVRRSWIL